MVGRTPTSEHTRATTGASDRSLQQRSPAMTRPVACVGRLVSVNVGLPKDVSWQGKTVFTGVFKAPVTGPRHVGRLNIDGDGQGDVAGTRRRAARGVRL